MSEITIRRLSEDDADRVRELDGLILGPDRSGTWDEYVGRFLATSKVSIMSTPTWGSFVAEEDRELVGFILAGTAVSRLRPAARHKNRRYCRPSLNTGERASAGC